MTPLLFEAGGCRVRELDASDVPRVQALFDTSPEYFQAVNGRAANPDEAQAEFDEMPPASFGYTKRWFTGAFDPQDRLVGVLVFVSDLCAPSVWHVTLLLVATPLRGTGLGPALYDALERWMHRAGARWLRLCVVAGNDVGERFWMRRGFREVCRRDGVDTGGRLNTIRVMAKPLDGQPIDDYLARVPRDRPAAGSVST